MTKTLTILIGFIHDFASGFWFSSIIAIAFLERLHIKYPAVADILNTIERFFFWNSIGAVVVILATGAGRTFTYVDKYYGADAEKHRRKMLVIKHIILFIIFSAGYLFAYSMTFH